MAKTTISVWLAVLIFAFGSNANDNERIAQLEKKLQEMEARLSKLESVISDTSKSVSRGNSDENWKEIAAWRRLKVDMSTTDVRKILGEPFRISGGDFEHWEYQNNGSLSFIRGKLARWMEPDH